MSNLPTVPLTITKVTASGSELIIKYINLIGKPASVTISDGDYEGISTDQQLPFRLLEA